MRASGVPDSAIRPDHAHPAGEGGPPQHDALCFPLMHLVLQYVGVMEVVAREYNSISAFSVSDETVRAAKVGGQRHPRTAKH